MDNLVSAKFFAEALKQKDTTIRQYIHKGILVKEFNGLMDINNPLNYKFIVRKNGGNLDVFKMNDANIVKKSENNMDFEDIELEKKKADLLLVQRNAELKLYELEKKAGNSLPLDVVSTIQTIMFQTVLSEFLLEIEKMVQMTVQEFGGNRSDTVKITNKLRTSFDKTLGIVKEKCKTKFEIAVNEYSEVRSRGERKV